MMIDALRNLLARMESYHQQHAALVSSAADLAAERADISLLAADLMGRVPDELPIIQGLAPEKKGGAQGAVADQQKPQATPQPSAALDALQRPSESAAPRKLGSLPKKDGSFDAPAAARILGDAIEASGSLDDVTAWQKLNMDWIEWLSRNAPPFAKQLEKRIAAVREILSGAEA